MNVDIHINYLAYLKLAYKGFTEVFSNLVVTRNNFIVSDQVSFRVFCYLFRQKWFDSFPKCSIINYSLSMKIAIKILFSFLED